MKQLFKVFSALLFTILAINSPADTLPVHIYNIQPSKYISPHQEARIILDDLWPGAVYTVTCDVFNNSNRPVKIILGDYLTTPPNFAVNDIPGNQAVLTNDINKYVAKQVTRISIQGLALSVRNDDDSAQLYINNCVATLAID